MMLLVLEPTLLLGWQVEVAWETFWKARESF
jgi:hypothetical protein